VQGARTTGGRTYTRPVPRPGRFRPALIALLAAAVVTAGAAGCGDDSGLDATVPAETTGAPADTTAAPATTATQTPDGSGTSAATDAEAAPDTADQPDPTGDPTASAGASERLQAAGYDVVQSQTAGVDPRPLAALETSLDGGGGLTVYVYDDRGDARRLAGTLRPLARQGGPRFVGLRVEGSTVYFALVQEQGQRLDRAEFAHVVDIAAGSRP
jgi:hypothetical protein